MVAERLRKCEQCSDKNPKGQKHRIAHVARPGCAHKNAIHLKGQYATWCRKDSLRKIDGRFCMNVRCRGNSVNEIIPQGES